MLEDIRATLMEGIVAKKAIIQTAVGDIYPKIRVKLKKERLEARNCHLLSPSNVVFQVSH